MPLLTRIIHGWTLLGGGVLFAIVAATAINVASYAANEVAQGFGSSVASLPGYEEFVTLMISAVALMCFPYCQLHHGHIAVDLFAQRLPNTLQRLMDSLSLALMALLALFLAYWMVIGLLEVRSDGVVSSILGWPQWPFYIPGIVSLWLWAAVAVSQIPACWQGNPGHG